MFLVKIGLVDATEQEADKIRKEVFSALRSEGLTSVDIMTYKIEMECGAHISLVEFLGELKNLVVTPRNLMSKKESILVGIKNIIVNVTGNKYVRLTLTDTVIYR